MRTPPPCKIGGVDCSSRHVGCRTMCQRWKEWEIIHADEKAAARRKKEVDYQIDSFIGGQNKRIMLDQHRKSCERSKNT